MFVTYVLASHTLNQYFGVLVDEHMGHGLLGVCSSAHGFNQSVLLRNSVVDHSSLDES